MDVGKREQDGRTTRRPWPLNPYDARDRGVVHRAVAVMRSRISEPLSVARIATACGTSHRTLHRALRREYGLSPMALLRRERLAMARAALCWPTEATTVTQVALSWGFEHLGRFSRYYARQFGELPSDTLQRARARSSAIALPRAG